MPAALADSVLEPMIAFAERLAQAAALETLRWFKQPLDVSDKGSQAFDPVTEADRAAERAMRTLIEAEHPDHGVDGEEYGHKPATGPWTWVLDPIDGTRAYISGVPTWTTLIGCRHEGAPVIGVIDQPYIGERFLGAGGRAAVQRGSVRRPMRVRQCAHLTNATLSCTDPPAMFAPAEAAAFEQVRRAARFARYGLDAYGYAALADGWMDLVIESSLQSYDVAALIPIVEGAGGVVTDWRGRARPSSGQVVAAGDRRSLEEALVALKRAAD